MVVEQEQEVNRILERAAKAKHADLESWEIALRAAVLCAGSKVLGSLLKGIGAGRREAPVTCGCGTRMQSHGLKSKPLLTILGPVPYQRSMYQCPACGRTRYPGDEELDIVDTTRSPGLRRMMGRAGSRGTFKQGCEDLKVYAGIEVSAKNVERVAEATGDEIEQWSQSERRQLLVQQSPVREDKTIPVLYICYDGTGVPMTRQELTGRKGKQADGSALTREAKLGCVFTQATTDETGFPVRDPESTSFVGAIESSEQFGWRIYAEAVRRGLFQAAKAVVLGDGAEWVRSVAEHHFPGSIHIIDLYHARQHVSDLCKILSASDRQVVRFRTRWWTYLDEGKIEKIVEEAIPEIPSQREAKRQAKGEIAYLDKNKERMRYAQFRRQGLFVGSGVVEAGCKTLIGLRMKQSGMEWSLRGANAIIALRCTIQSGRFQDYWESRAG